MRLRRPDSGAIAVNPAPRYSDCVGRSSIDAAATCTGK
ncbi:hypothetical protein DSM3645_03613 [Blastopirellula marina DSM 3645]|uniref:Uncharacterized protein n=1 Tax=Blastopirellula marina DSM 3645 TaxID=314230 RepID=A3ZW34_9BACT|nr:hypothetical protein DSM3645_03613 [Blastopirellula marina DSM 3645]